MDGSSLLGSLPLVLVLVMVGSLVYRARKAKGAMQTQIAFAQAERTYSGPLSFVRRHHNGDYSLARSYWINTFLVSLFAPILGVLMLPWLSENVAAQ